MTSNEAWTLGIAAYAAAISTFVLGWDAYKWLASGPKIKLSASTGMNLIGGARVDNNTYVSATATNLGDRATTITNLGYQYYNSWFSAVFRRSHPSQSFVISTPSESQVLPYRFEPGAQWIGLAIQDEKVLQMVQDGYLYVVLYHSHGGPGVRYHLKRKD